MPARTRLAQGRFHRRKSAVLGFNRIRQELSDEYVESLFKLYKDLVPAFAGLCCYWF